LIARLKRTLLVTLDHKQFSTKEANGPYAGHALPYHACNARDSGPRTILGGMIEIGNLPEALYQLRRRTRDQKQKVASFVSKE
jgi:hypothetical protein